MSKSLVIPILIISVLLVLVLMTSVLLRGLGVSTPLSTFTPIPIITPGNPQAEHTIVGILRTVGVSGEEIGMANNLHGLNARFQVINQGELPYSANQYVWGNFTNPEVEARYEALTTTQSGYCVQVTAPIITTPPPAAEFTQSMPIITISDFTLIDDYSCYDNNADLFATQPPLLNQPMVQVTTTIMAAPRPAYDIGYDYEVILPWSQASQLGYGDASGLEHPATTPTHIYVTANSLTVAKDIETAKRLAEPVTITGQFAGGYAESTVLQINEISFE